MEEQTIIGMTCIRMKALKRTDTGDYTLIMQNDYGKCTRTYHVTVLGKYTCTCTYACNFHSDK